LMNANKQNAMVATTFWLVPSWTEEKSSAP
jgi:hypothetical protein